MSHEGRRHGAELQERHHYVGRKPALRGLRPPPVCQQQVTDWRGLRKFLQRSDELVRLLLVLAGERLERQRIE